MSQITIATTVPDATCKCGATSPLTAVSVARNEDGTYWTQVTLPPVGWARLALPDGTDVLRCPKCTASL